MSEISKVIEEEFDEEGNLVRRTTTEYGPRYTMGGVVRAPGSYIQYNSGSVIAPREDGTYTVNLREDVV